MLTNFYSGSIYTTQFVSPVHSFCKLYFNFSIYDYSIFVNGNSNKGMWNIGTHIYTHEDFTLKF